MENIKNNEEFIYEEKYSHPCSIALNLTNDCNLACKYCFVNQKPEYMSLDIAIQAVEYVIKNVKLHKEIYKDIPENQLGNIWFFGGEPLLCFDTIIKPLIQYCEEKEYLPLLTFSLTTNATLLNKEKVEFCKKYNIIPMLSIDGDPETQDFQRPCKNPNLKSSKLVEANIPIILEYLPDTMFRSTIYKPTIKQLFQNYLYAESLGFKYITLTPDTKQLDWTEQEYQLLEDQLQQIFAYRLLQYRNNYMPMGYSNVELIYSKILQHDIDCIDLKQQNISPTNLWYCGLGTSSAAVDFQGRIFTCQEQPTKINNQKFILGTINTGIDFDKHKKFLMEYINDINNLGFRCNDIKLCHSCLFKNQCTYCCIASSNELFDNNTTLNAGLCRYEQILTKLCLNNMDILVSEKNKTFYLYILKNIQSYQQYFSNLLENNNYFCL